MDRKRFWLCPNRSVGYGHPVTNQFRGEDSVEVYLNLDKKRKISRNREENYLINCKKSKF